MTQNISTVRRKKKKEEEKGKEKKKLINIAIGILHTSHILSSIICRLCAYTNYFLFIIYSRHDNWFMDYNLAIILRNEKFY